MVAENVWAKVKKTTSRAWAKAKDNKGLTLCLLNCIAIVTLPLYAESTTTYTNRLIHMHSTDSRTWGETTHTAPLPRHEWLHIIASCGVLIACHAHQEPSTIFKAFKYWPYLAALPSLLLFILALIKTGAANNASFDGHNTVSMTTSSIVVTSFGMFTVPFTVWWPKPKRIGATNRGEKIELEETVTFIPQRSLERRRPITANMWADPTFL